MTDLATLDIDRLAVGTHANDLVARHVMGWTEIRPHVWIDPQGEPALTDDAYEWVTDRSYHAWWEGDQRAAFHPSSDLADAWLVAERLRALGLRPVIRPDWGHQWQVVVYRTSDYVCQSPWCDRVPDAIFRAALKAVQHQQRGSAT